MTPAMSEEEQQRFLPKQYDEGSWTESSSKRAPSSRVRQYIHVAVTVCLALLCSALTLYIYCDKRYPKPMAKSTLQPTFDLSPARQAVEYHLESAPSEETWFRGAPAPDFQVRWEQFAQGTLIQVSKEDLVRAGENNSVALKNGGYAAGLAYSHQLHCIKRIKDILWIEKVAPKNATRDSAAYLEIQDHADHCLDILRQHVMCNIDTSLNRLEWVEKSKVTRIPVVTQAGPRMCTDWRKLHEWMRANAAHSNDFVEPDWDTL